MTFLFLRWKFAPLGVGGFLLCLEEVLDGSSSGKERDMM
jgi:hypothetical protein